MAKVRLTKKRLAELVDSFAAGLRSQHFWWDRLVWERVNRDFLHIVCRTGNCRFHTVISLFALRQAPEYTHQMMHIAGEHSAKNWRSLAWELSPTFEKRFSG